MFQQLINLFSGNFVRSLMQFYRQYSQIINSLVIIYGFSLLWVHNNLRTVIKKMEQLILHIASELKDNTDYHRIHKQFVKQWNDLVAHNRFVIPSKNDFWYERKTGRELIDVLYIKPEYVYVVLKKQNDEAAEQDSMKKKFRIWEEYRHNLRIGIRSKTPDTSKK